jgi:hypothetical protein
VVFGKFSPPLGEYHVESRFFSRPIADGPMFTFLLWCLLLFFCWPLALAVLFLYPVVWLMLLPFRLIGMTFHAVFETLDALLTLPARIIRQLV